MKEILINVSKETRMVDLNKSVIGNDGENLQGKLIFTFVDEFVDGQARLEYEIKGNKNYVVLDKEDETYTIPVKNVITKEGQIDMQLVITEGTDEEEIPVFKSNKFYLFCNSSINAVDEAPNGYKLWIEQANIKLNQIDNLDIDIENSIVTITKKDGSKIIENVKGEKGEKGDAGSVKFIIANELPMEDIDDSAIYMIPAGATSEGNTYEEYIYVNGIWESLGSASVNVDLADYVKNTDYATSDKAGVVKVHEGYGIKLLNNTLTPASATPADIKAQGNGVKPITPSNVSEVVKQGLINNQLDWAEEEKVSARELLKALGTGDVATQGDIKTKTNNTRYLTSKNIDLIVKMGLLDSKVEWTDTEKASARNLLGGHITLTQSEYDALETKDENVFYYIVEE